jgi:hypothetical protein
MEQVTVTHEGQTITVPIDKLTLPEGYTIIQPGQTPEGFMPSAAFTAELDRRTKGLKRPDDLLGDDDFFKRAAQKRGIDLGEDLKPVGKLDPEKVKQLQAAWEAEKLEPVLKERDDFRKEADSGRHGNLIRDLLQAAPETGLKPTRLKTIFEGETPEFIERAANAFEWDADRKAWFFKNAVSGQPEYEGAGYAGPRKYLEMLRKRDKDFEYFDDKRPGGSGYDKPGFGGSNTMTRKGFAGLNPQAQSDFVMNGGAVVDD